MIDRSLRVAGYTRVATLVLLENSIEVKSSIDILHVLWKFLACPLFDPLHRRISGTLRLARHFGRRAKLQPLVHRLRGELELLLDRQTGSFRKYRREAFREYLAHVASLVGQVGALQVQGHVAVVIRYSMSRRAAALFHRLAVFQPTYVGHRRFHAEVGARQRHGISLHYAQALRRAYQRRWS